MTEHLVNDVKICQNVELKLYQKLDLDRISGDYNELMELIDLFRIDTWTERERELLVHEKNINKRYLPQIREAKRVLKNTEKRLEYNCRRSDLLKTM